MKLRDYQEECLDQINKMSNTDKKVCYMATGAGKTIIMAELARRTTGRVLIVVDSTELREQTLGKIKKVAGNDIEVGIVQGTLNETDKKIVIATRQSLTHCKSNRLDKMLEAGNFDIVLIDECHRACHQIKKIIDKVGNVCPVVGFTATPWNSEMVAIFDGFVYQKGIEELIEEGYLCNPRCFKIDSNTDLSHVKTVAGEFNQGELSRAVDTVERNNLIVKAYLDKASNRNHTIVFASSIEHATNLARAFEINGISAKSVDSTVDNKSREQVINDFKLGKFEVLVNVSILTTGFDFEKLDCVIMARPTKSKILYTQCLGRGLRIHEDKEDCLVLDIVDNVRKHNLVNSTSIFDTKDGETILEARDRVKREKKERQLRLEEQKRIEQEQEELRLKEINLFNSDLHNICDVSNLDWFFHKINGHDVAILSARDNLDYFIFRYDNEFVSVKCIKKLGQRSELEFIDSNTNLREVVEKLDDIAMKNGSSFINFYSTWKYENATDKQKSVCKFDIKSKWDCHKYFARRNSWYSLKDVLIAKS